ncbi:MAG: efflux RND transporter permease subunit [Gemmatimonadaceae bacterium]|nr:efflux RND transporter permease subunit [Gemmatimonadaceae bacterium]
MIRFATHRPAVVWAVSVAILVAGAIGFTRLPLASRTSVELPRLTVASAWNGASAEVMEMYVTSPVEALVQGVRGVKRTTSESRDNGMNITVELEANADVQLARLGILERLELLRAEFPPGVTPPSVSNYTPEGLEEPPLLQVEVSGPYTPGTLQKLLLDQVAPRLSAVPGVSSVADRGGSDLGVAVSYDPALLRRIDLGPQLLTSTLNGARVVQSLGRDVKDGVERSVTLRDEPKSLEAVAQLPVAAPDGRVFRLSELSTIRAEEDAQGRFFRINGVPAVAVHLYRHANADAIKTAIAARAAVDELQRVAPPGVQYRVSQDASIDLDKELTDLLRRGGIAFVAVLLVLAVMLRRARAVVLVMGSTAVAIAGTALGLYLLDIPANLLTLAGLGMGVGILVQNALVVVNRLATAPDTPTGRAEATWRITPAIIGATLTTAVVLFPFLYLQGDTRAAFVPFAAAFALALLWSVLTALFVVPALGRGAAVRPVRWPRIGRVYRAMLRGLLRWRWATVLGSTVLLAIMTWGFIKKVPRSAWGGWGERRTTLAVNLTFPRGSDPETLDRAMREFEALVTGRPEVEQVVTNGNMTSAYMQVLFTREGGLTAVPLELEELLTQRAVLVGGANISVRGDGPGFYAGGGGGSSVAFRIRVTGYSYSGVTALAEDLKARLELIARVRDVTITSGRGWGNERGYAVTLEPDREALHRHGVTSQDFAAAVAREVRGPVGRLLLEVDGDELPVTVKSAGARDRTLDELREAIVPTPTSAPVRLADLAVVDAREALSIVTREDQQYIRHVNFDFRGPQRLAQRTYDAFLATVATPPGYEVKDAGSLWGYRDDQSAKGLWLVFGVGLALVILAVALVFDSVWGSAMVFLSLPLSLAGVVAAFWATKSAFGREAAVGVILVVGLAVNQAILLVDAALVRRRARLARGGSGALHAGDVLRAASDRSGMIVLVTLSALASLAPLSVGTDATTLFGAIALATAGGTVMGTAAALFLLPPLLVGRRLTPRKPWRWRRRAA